MKFDLHMHTRRYSPDSIIDPEQLIRQAKAVGLDGIVITEHDRLWPEHELEELRQMQPDLVILGGVEVSARGGDVLCYGVTDLTNLRRGVSWRDLVAEVHRQGGVAVAAHPYRWGQDFDALLKEQNVTLDGVEVMSNNMDKALRRATAKFTEKHPEYATLGNSDAHEIDVVGCCRTEFGVPVLSLADLVRAIQERQTTPMIHNQ
ncbi:PHP-associated domain-containing protein [Zavarzinella formosa]|uniref:PHP-associated domain-containing protein n=1 Tax=Zavarzinella formosa TaxID=360055 RepID=UPI000304FE17|nr:PHP domain-containing protein [Zavarzinella formosa]